MESPCYFSMPRAGNCFPKRSVYWWTDEIANIMDDCVCAGCWFTRARSPKSQLRRGSSRLVVGVQHGQTSTPACDGLCQSQALGRPPGDLRMDSCGRPYRTSVWVIFVPVTEQLEPGFLGRVLSVFFPSSEVLVGDPPRAVHFTWTNELGVTMFELSRAVRRIRDASVKASSPGGVPGLVLKDCLSRGTFRKVGRPADSPSPYRSLCLLYEAGKISGKFLADRLVDHLPVAILI